MRKIAPIVLLVVAAGNGATWLWARDQITDALVRELRSDAKAIWVQKGWREPIPQIGAAISWSVPVLPGLFVVSYAPTTDGHAPCIDGQAIVLSYGLDATVLLRWPRPLKTAATGNQ